MSHRFPCRVYYEDTDHGGVVYYANYLKFMERGRTEYLRSAGIELDSVEKEEGVMFAVTEANIRYRSPALFNDLLEIESTLTHARGARLTFKQQVWRMHRKNETRDTLLTEAEIKLACIDRDGNARRIPASLIPVLATHQTNSSKESPNG
ncbi:MAG TPA: tol-pal system-associated acyl-CoA thioesterase [Mariprofundaceae bacterium]|nr:tol-pal system-associated acyl-CoA thioesterase [Mariprofundaceae bacterium]